MITRDYWRLSHPAAPQAASYGTRAMVEEWRDRNPLRRPAETYLIEKVPCCDCCGDDSHIVVQRGGFVAVHESGAVRCDRHYGRNPCAIEGCKRTTAAPSSGELRNDQWFCGEHWRRYVPPRSLRRRLYHRFFRLAKRDGWGDDLRRRFWRFWDRLVADARRRATEGDLNMDEIERIIG